MKKRVLAKCLADSNSPFVTTKDKDDHHQSDDNAVTALQPIDSNIVENRSRKRKLSFSSNRQFVGVLQNRLPLIVKRITYVFVLDALFCHLTLVLLTFVDRDVKLIVL